MRFINLKTKKYPLTLQDIRLENPQVSFPDNMTLPPDGYAEVLDVETPVIDKLNFTLVEGPPVEKNNVWHRVWEIVEHDENTKLKLRKTCEQGVRDRRDSLLKTCDWTQLADVNLANKADWNKYRQELRDITTQPGFPFNVTWPPQPEL